MARVYILKEVTIDRLKYSRYVIVSALHSGLGQRSMYLLYLKYLSDVLMMQRL